MLKMACNRDNGYFAMQEIASTFMLIPLGKRLELTFKTLSNHFRIENKRVSC